MMPSGQAVIGIAGEASGSLHDAPLRWQSSPRGQGCNDQRLLQEPALCILQQPPARRGPCRSRYGMWRGHAVLQRCVEGETRKRLERGSKLEEECVLVAVPETSTASMILRSTCNHGSHGDMAAIPPGRWRVFDCSVEPLEGFAAWRRWW